MVFFWRANLLLQEVTQRMKVAARTEGVSWRLIILHFDSFLALLFVDNTFVCRVYGMGGSLI